MCKNKFPYLERLSPRPNTQQQKKQKQFFINPVRNILNNRLPGSVNYLINVPRIIVSFKMAGEKEIIVGYSFTK